MKTSLVFVSFSFCCCSLFAQTRNPALDINRANIWRFGKGTTGVSLDAPSLDFSSGSPVVVIGGQMLMDGSSTISDTSGALQLYGGSLKMFDRTHIPMVNSGVVGDSGWTGISQNNLAIPMPNHPDLIYYFSASVTLRYSVVDMRLNGGNGAVIKRNVELEPTYIGVKLGAVHHCNGSDIWIMGHRWASDTFFAYLLTDTGVNMIPVINTIGPVDGQGGFEQGGNIKFSPNGNKMAITFNGFDTPSYVFDFDKSTGVLSNPVPLQKIFGENGISFSPDNKVLYISTNNAVVLQYNLEAGSAAAIAASKIKIADEAADFINMQLGRDGKIYLVSSGAPANKHLSVINKPNALDTFCDYRFEALYLNGASGSAGSLMNTVESYFYTGSSAYPCYGDTTVGVSASISQLQVKVYPNPAADYTVIETYGENKDAEMRYELFDALGKQQKAHFIESASFGDTRQMIVYRRQLKQGIYFLQLSGANKKQLIKLIFL